jgi:AMMECR1 domain-containing protein
MENSSNLILDIVKQTIDFYTKYLKIPEIDDIKIKDTSFFEKKWCVFVTIYKNGEIRWWAWNIKELKESIVFEIIENTIEAISKDTRFSALKLDEIKDLKIRVDIIKQRKILKEKEIFSVDPIKNWIIAIKNDYSTMTTILPNIGPLLLEWKDFIPVLEEKMKIPKFVEEDFIIYVIETEVINNF